MEQNEIIGSNIKNIREAMGLSQEDLAKFLNVKRENISYYETGNRNIPSEIVTKCADLFGVDEYDLMEENAEMQIANVAFAFRADALVADDLPQIASFRKVVKNYLKMKEKVNESR
jgi:transcriptional regulator with XRE-family HTH domain